MKTIPLKGTQLHTPFPKYFCLISTLGCIKQMAKAQIMETQLFILKYWYELTGQQYSPTCTVHSHFSILLFSALIPLYIKKYPN